jgi:hypothetical protein
MKKRLLALAGTLASVLAFGAVAAPAHASYTGYGVPSYSSYYTPSYSSYTTPSSDGYRRPGQYLVRGYVRRNGTYVAPYLRRYPVRSSYLRYLRGY